MRFIEVNKHFWDIQTTNYFAYIRYEMRSGMPVASEHKPLTL